MKRLIIIYLLLFLSSCIWVGNKDALDYDPCLERQEGCNNRD